MSDALVKMQAALLEALITQPKAPNQASTSITKSQNGTSSIEERLNRLKSLFNQGVLDKDEYNKKRAALLDEL